MRANRAEISSAQEDMQGLMDNLNKVKNAPLQKLNAKGTLGCTHYSRTSK